ncbi:MAG: hypothetical protein OEV74_10545 [Cyclobacteriaceae bacterium]|nr:hypothetical protein [Cyclobacteriaceae bacterium]MDH4296708.1 hypothetical protein [Cyclobacteriaceae bacterium]MDH5250225.1 hypothetical protein [Cyclobacteriaceae bacterium]
MQLAKAPIHPYPPRRAKYYARISYRLIITLSVFGPFTLTTCGSSNFAQAPHSSIKQQIQSQVGENFVTKYNASGSYALITPKQAPENIETNMHFLVLRLADSAVVKDGSYLRGYVKWVDDETLEKLSLPGKVKQDQDLSVFKSIIHVSQPSPNQ